VTNTDVPKISLSDLKDIFHDKSSERSEKMYKLKNKLDSLIEEGLWEPCEVLPTINNDIESSTRDCILSVAYPGGADGAAAPPPRNFRKS